MARIPAPTVFPDDDPAPMLTHLDRWATSTLTDSGVWGSMIERCSLWADYSPRNQVLLASYGIATPVAGAATWEQVPSSEAGRPCAVRADEHGLPVRVPVPTTITATSSRSRSGQRAKVPGSMKWERVFAAEQLARRPAVGALAWSPVPDHLTGPDAAGELAQTVRKAVGRLTGQTPRRAGDPWEHLVDVAGTVPLGPRRPELRPALCRQAAWLALDRLGHAPGPLPDFEPTRVRGRLRWELLVDARRATGQIVRAFSDVLDVDLAASALPRMDIAADRTVARGRRNYLAPADVSALPRGVWVEVGPYTEHEWAGRGVPGAQGRAGFLRVSDTGYLAAYETAEGARWRVESTRTGHRGLLDEGTTDTYDAALQTVTRVVADRYPALAAVLPADVSDAPVRVFTPDRDGWQPMADARDGRAQHRQLTDRIQLVVAPGPGGRWENLVITDHQIRQLPLNADEATAKKAAEQAGRRTALAHAAETPQLADRLIADAASNGSLTHELLHDVVGHRLADLDAAALADPALPAGRLAEVLADTGVLTPPTIVDVLVATDTPLDELAPLVPQIGIPIPDALRALSDHYGVGRVEVGALLGATAAEMQGAGCSPAELLAAHPREILRSLDARPHTWETAATTMTESGTPVPVVVRHLAAHAPTPETFACGVAMICDRPDLAFSYSARHAQPDDLAALGAVYGLDPAITAQLLADAATHPASAYETLVAACDGDTDAAAALSIRHLNVDPATLDLDGATAVADLTTISGLRAALPSPNAASGADLSEQLAALVERTAMVPLAPTRSSDP
jgi:hypothetical protein